MIFMELGVGNLFQTEGRIFFWAASEGHIPVVDRARDRGGRGGATKITFAFIQQASFYARPVSILMQAGKTHYQNFRA